MYRDRRSFTREILKLQPEIETEFSGQIKLLPFEETDMNSVLVEITPSKGFYAHASFIFRVEVTTSYPFQGPKISCLTNIFHPNIADRYEDNICLNLTSNWLPRYGLKDILYALLFLLYEPNFDDPMNHNASRPEEGLTMEMTILKSLRGGTVNDIYYAPNEAWCRWAEENNVSFTLPTCSAKDLPHDGNEVSMTSAARQQSTLSGYFIQALSGQFTPVTHSARAGWPYHFNDESPVDFAFLRHITLRPACTSGSFDVEDILNSAKRYYYTELGGYSKCNRIAALTARSACVPTLNDYGLNWQSQQVSAIGFYSLPTARVPTVFSEDFFTHEQYLEEEMAMSDADAETQIFTESEHEPDGNEEETAVERDAQNESNVRDADTTESDVAQRQQQHSGISDLMAEPLTGFQEAIEEEMSEGLPLDVISHVAETGEYSLDQVPTEDHQEQQQQEQTPHDTNASFVWENLTESVLESDKCSSVGDSEIVWLGNLDWCFAEQQMKVVSLKPWSWVLYRTRWPPYLAPGHITEISRAKRQPRIQRASSTILRSDLFRVGNRCGSQSLFILVDSLSISPFSPIINRAVCFTTRTRNAVTWYSLDWFSVWDVFKPTFAAGDSLTRPNHFRWPTVLFGLCYVHNWVAYLSRMELYGLCLGYSRPWKDSLLNYAASRCLTPATLGCGQCGLLDAWPLWLTWRTVRLLCHLVALLSAKAVPQNRCPSVTRPRLFFPFSDLDEI